MATPALTRYLLEQYIEHMIDLEGQILGTLEATSELFDEHGETAKAVNGLRSIVQSQRSALQARSHDIISSRHVRTDLSPAKERSFSHGGTPMSAISALERLYGHLNEAAFGYAVLHLMAHRWFDSSGEGNTADLAEKHLASYTRAVQDTSQLTSDTVIWELAKAGQECQCQCPSCGLGICLCSPHGSNTANDVWHEAFRAATEAGGQGIRVRPPRTGSPAYQAGLRAGDIVVGVDDHEIRNEGWDSIKTQQDAIRKHPSGEVVRLRVKHASGDLEEISVTRK